MALHHAGFREQGNGTPRTLTSPMPDRSEHVRLQPLPQDLALRVAIGRAAEVLAIMHSTHVLPQTRKRDLRDASLALRPRGGSATAPTASSLGGTLQELDVVIAARDAMPSAELGALRTKLEAWADDLDRLAGAQGLETVGLDRVATLIDELDAMRDAISRGRTTPTDALLGRDG